MLGDNLLYLAVLAYDKRLPGMPGTLPQTLLSQTDAFVYTELHFLYFLLGHFPSPSSCGFS